MLVPSQHPREKTGLEQRAHGRRKKAASTHEGGGAGSPHPGRLDGMVPGPGRAAPSGEGAALPPRSRGCCGAGGTGRRRGGTRGPAGGEGRFGCRRGGSSQVIRRKPPEILFSQGRDIPPPPRSWPKPVFPVFAPPPARPGTALRSCPLPSGQGEGGGTHTAPQSLPGVDTIWGPLLCRGCGNAARGFPPQSSSSAVQRVDNELVVVAFKSV